MSPLSQAIRRSVQFGLFSATALAVSASDPLQVYFLHTSQTVREQSVASIYLELSTYPLTELVVPFRILTAESTATLQTEDADGVRSAGDYFIAAADEGNESDFFFDPATGQGSFTWLGFPNRRFFNLEIARDDFAEENETIVIEIDTDGLSGLVPGNPTRHVITIQDDDTPTAGSPYDTHVYFERQAYRMSESGILVVPIRLLSASPLARRVTYELSFDATASAADLDLDYPADDSATAEREDLTFSVEVAAESTSASVLIPIFRDLDEEGDESFTLRLVKTEFLDEAGAVSPDTTLPPQSVSSDPVTLTIIDDDPTTVQMDFSNLREEFQDGFTFSEGDVQQFSLNLTLSSPAAFPVEVPISFTGTATRGTESNDDGSDWRPNPDRADTNDVYTIPAGETTTALSLFFVNDIVEEDRAAGETVVVTLGTPQAVDTTGTPETRTDLTLGSGDALRSLYTVTILDNDPVQIGFGRSNPDLLLDDVPANTPLFVDDAEIVFAENSGGGAIDLYGTGVPAITARFEIQVVSDGTTATMRDFNLTESEQEDWDFYIVFNTPNGAATVENFDESVEGIFSAGRPSQTINIVLNDDEEPALPWAHFEAWSNGTVIPDEDGVELSKIEPEETIKLRLVSIVNTDESGVELRTQAADSGINPLEFTIRIREMPDIDLTEMFDGLVPDLTGDTPRNAKTRLHEIAFDLQAKAALADELVRRRDTAEVTGDGSLDGYTAYKLSFQSSIYDLDNAEDPNNDPIRDRILGPDGLLAFEPDGFTPYLRLAVPRFAPKYADSFELVELLAPVEQPVNQPAFTEENAGIFAIAPYILHPLNFDPLDPDNPAERIGLAEPGDPMDFLIEFSNSGRSVFSADERARRLAGTRVLLMRDADPAVSGSGFSGRITGFEETDAGIVLEIFNPSSGGIQIEYMDAEGDDAGIWKPAQPGFIGNTGTNFFWIDQGPPKTDVHPREVNFRLYRITN
jgi:hypothetical protein